MELTANSGWRDSKTQKNGGFDDFDHEFDDLDESAFAEIDVMATTKQQLTARPGASVQQGAPLVQQTDRRPVPHSNEVCAPFEDVQLRIF